ncbi:MAG: citramalate synthase, partial [Candidatus Omnitrophota bacterium]
KKAKNLKLKNSQLVAFGSTRHAKSKPASDPVLKALLSAHTKVITIFGKAWDLHVKEVLRVSHDENLRMISDSIRFLRSKGKKVFFDAEHFFDGYMQNPKYAIEAVIAAQEAGAACVILCDTNGGTITSEVSKITEEIKAYLKVPVGIHCHNDSDLGVANSVAAVQAGATHVQGTINGYGERCGNANLTSIIPTLQVKLGIKCIPEKNLKNLTEVSRFVSEVCNMRQRDNQPFVGESAFAHKAGVHINAILKNKQSYEHMDPSLIGNRRRILVSELTGKSGFLKKAEELELSLDKESPKTKRLLKKLQELEHSGYHFEAAEASLKVLMRRSVKKFKEFFSLQEFRVIVEKREKAKELISEATLKLKVGKALQHTAALGDGPVNALDNALRKALKDFYPALSEMHLTDFKVRVLDETEGTAAKVRVLIQSQDQKHSWWTIGVSENIIEASWQALADSVVYKLLNDTK